MRKTVTEFTGQWSSGLSKEAATSVAQQLPQLRKVRIGIGHPYHRHYYNYYGGGAWNGCPPDWTIQGGVCKPYRHGPWDIYGGRQSDYGY